VPNNFHATFVKPSLIESLLKRNEFISGKVTGFRVIFGYPINDKNRKIENQKIMSKNICAAKTRKGTACLRSPMRNGRCNLHGGKSLFWMAHPNYKHGRYSKYSGVPEKERANREFEKAEKRSVRKREMFHQMVALEQEKKGRDLTVKEFQLLINTFFPVK
jgi:hypothetical protein